MTEAVLNHGRDAVTSGSMDGGTRADGSRFTGNRKLSQAAVAPREGWVRQALQAAASFARKSTPLPFASGSHELCKGMVRRAHLPNGGRIFCRTGRVWITADGGGEDVVLSSAESWIFRPGASLLIEAIAKSEIIVKA